LTSYQNTSLAELAHSDFMQAATVNFNTILIHPHRFRELLLDKVKGFCVTYMKEICSLQLSKHTTNLLFARQYLTDIFVFIDWL